MSTNNKIIADCAVRQHIKCGLFFGAACRDRRTHLWTKTAATTTLKKYTGISEEWRQHSSTWWQLCSKPHLPVVRSAAQHLIIRYVVLRVPRSMITWPGAAVAIATKRRPRSVFQPRPLQIPRKKTNRRSATFPIWVIQNTLCMFSDESSV